MKDVYQRKVIKSAGMSLIEVLISLSIFFIIVAMVPAVFSMWHKADLGAIAHEEQVIFFSQLQMDFRESSEYWLNDSKTILYFTKESDAETTIQYELYQDLIRRRVNRRGHEVLLQSVQQILLEKQPFGITVEVVSTDGMIYRRNIVHPKSSTDGDLIWNS